MSWQRRFVGIVVGAVVAAGLLLCTAYISFGLWGDADDAGSVPVALDAEQSRDFAQIVEHRRAHLISERFPLAEVPWVLRDRQTPAHVALALLPRLNARHDPQHPSPAVVSMAHLPWRPRTVAATRFRARVQVEQATAPSIRRKRDPRSPEPAKVVAAEVPWQRDANSPAPANIEAARVSPRLKAAEGASTQR